MKDLTAYLWTSIFPYIVQTGPELRNLHLVNRNFNQWTKNGKYMLRIPSLDNEAQLNQLFQKYPYLETATMVTTNFSNQTIQNLVYSWSHLRALKLDAIHGNNKWSAKYVTSLKPLEQLDLYLLSLTGFQEINSLECLKKMDHLKHLELSNMPKIGDDSFQVIGCLNLKHLHLCDLDISSQGFEIIRTQQRLESLHLTYFPGYCMTTEGSDPRDSTIAQLTNLRELSLNWINNLTNEKFMLLHGLSNLRKLTLDYLPSLSYDGFQIITGFTNLTHLTITTCPNLDHHTLLILKKLNKLKHLNISANQLNRQDIEALTTRLPYDHTSDWTYQEVLNHHINLQIIQQLTHLDITGNYSLSNVITPCILQFRRLVDLRISYPITDQSLHHIVTILQDLKVLHLLNASKITDLGIMYFGAIKLRKLVISNCRGLTDHGMGMLKKLPYKTTYL